MRIGVDVDGLGKAKDLLAKLSGPQARQAYAKAINDTAFQVRRAMQTEMRKVFDRPTPFILSSPRVRMATADSLVADIEPTYAGGKGVDPQKVLQTQTLGGRRRDKRSESALRRVGILPRGYQTAIPRTPYPGSDDGRGNIRGPFLVQLLSYFQAQGEQGYRSNMNDKGRARVQRGTARQAGRRYFVSYGKLRGGAGAHLPPGIWAAAGPGGVDVRPVLMFVRIGNYQRRLSMERIAQTAQVDEYMARRMRFRIREMAGV
ncbi:hypothetical protein [Xylophilus ampelinus]|uniref:Uncharacterized protein n=1 Tax=Xylophilus ampelinus TaxID=54067 RepID=A0A318SPW1_9BURK|nr:hypothetical protein [Xylophilus ampelinus]MCS4508905.1 hypothetical protein [Xylophilus ampelinus]PYE79472.1 hypothetical protein DFQ15_102205 [Xylophilus ampelinus]